MSIIHMRKKVKSEESIFIINHTVNNVLQKKVVNGKTKIKKSF